MNQSFRRASALIAGLAGLFVFLSAAAARAADLKLALPLVRTAYQTNERIDFTVTRAATGPGELQLVVAGEDGSRMTFTIPVQNAVEFLHLNGWLLRPGNYAVAVSEGSATAKAEIALFSHIRQSSFRLVNWGRAQGKQQLVEGEEDLGFNLFYGGFQGADEGDNLIRAGVDVMGVCVMGGSHQMDMRYECDWSDPYVTRGGSQRVARKAFEDRTRGNVAGVHFYDEPGLTWWKDPANNNEQVPHNIPAQVRAYESAFGHPPIDYKTLDPNQPADAAAWKQWAIWKLGFMDAAWKEGQFGVNYVRPDYLTATQSQYGWMAFTDGYYFNVVRSLPIISGHGGYDDFLLDYFNPSWFLEMARARDLARPDWYLPCWYSFTTPDEFRLQQYLSFMTGIQGLITPPDMEAATNPIGRQGIVESNHLMGRLGTIFNTMPVTPAPVALLFSYSDLIAAQTKDRKLAYSSQMPQGACLPFTYLAVKLLQQPLQAVTDEDVIDGTVAANHQAVILSAVSYLDPAVVRGLEDFIAGGGLVLKAGDCPVAVKGAIDLGVKPSLPDENSAAYKQLVADKKYPELEPYQTVAKYVQGSLPLAKAIRAHLVKAGIKPVFACDSPTITATRQGAGDVEYLFAVNATPDPATGKRNAMKAAAATITVDADGGTLYDAIHGGPVAELKPNGKTLTGKFRFGPGQMRVFARTARPIGSVRVATPTISRDTTLAANPIQLDLGAAVVDPQGRVISGSIPLEIRVVSPLGETRYLLHRATKLGTLSLSLPLAANDPAGTWRVSARDLLANTEETATFTYQPMAKCGMLAGASHRAIMLGGEEANLFRFARVNQDVTIVKGASDYNGPAADRLKKALDPWGVRCVIVDAAAVSKPHAITEAEARTWVGLQIGAVKPGNGNPLVHAGFAINGPVILLGTPQDNPLITFLLEQKFLPYPADATFPGQGRGYVAWQRDGIGKGQESVTVIGYDAAGIAEAVGSFYEAVAGMDPLTPWTLPTENTIVAAKSAQIPPTGTVAWSVILPDRIVAVSAEKGGLAVLTHDGTLSEVNAKGKLGAQRVVDAAVSQQQTDATKPDAKAVAAAQKSAPPTRMAKLVATGKGLTAVGYWGGTIEVRDAGGAVKYAPRLGQDVTALVWLDDLLVAGDADGRLVAFELK